jgi:hypothetical protein
MADKRFEKPIRWIDQIEKNCVWHQVVAAFFMLGY